MNKQITAVILQAAKSVCADLMLLSGLALACAGVFRYSTPAGMIISGLVLALLGKATAMKMPQEKKI